MFRTMFMSGTFAAPSYTVFMSGMFQSVTLILTSQHEKSGQNENCLSIHVFGCILCRAVHVPGHVCEFVMLLILIIWLTDSGSWDP